MVIIVKPLITDPNLDAPDDFYQALIDAHRDLSVEQSHQLNARLILLLANHIGTRDVLVQALDAARRNALAQPSQLPQPSQPSTNHSSTP